MRILIGGDSWSQGEWGEDANNEYGVLHKGLEQYLKDDGHHIVNVGRGAFSNKSSLKAIKNELQDNDYDILIWFETSPARDIKHYNPVDTLEKCHERFDAAVKRSYVQLGSFDVPKKYIIGGLQKSNQDILTETGVDAEIIIESLIEWLTDGEVTQDEVYVGAEDVHRLRKAGFSLTVLNYLMDAAADIRVLELDRYTEYFRPDGGHTNRKGHLRIFRLLSAGGFLD